MSAQPVEPDPHPAEVLHIAPRLPGQAVPPGVVAVSPAEYDRIRRRAIAQQIRERTERLRQGDFSDFQEITSEEKAVGELNA
jgi:hypothetical protein